MNPQRAASPQQILEIRTQADAGALDVRVWAEMLGCSLETVRRYGRRETARDLPERKSAGRRAVNELNLANPATQKSAPEEPSEAELEASLQRLAALTAAETPRQRVDGLLAELTKKGASDDPA